MTCVKMEELIQFSFDVCAYKTEPKTFKDFVNDFDMRVVDCEKMFDLNIDYVITFMIKYKPTNRSMKIMYKKYRFDDESTLKNKVLRQLQQGTRKFNIGKWERVADKNGIWYINDDLCTRITEQCYKDWVWQIAELGELFPNNEFVEFLKA